MFWDFSDVLSTAETNNVVLKIDGSVKDSGVTTDS